MSRAGVTLVELLVVVLIIGLTIGIMALGPGRLWIIEHAAIHSTDRLMRARAEAIRTGVRVPIVDDSGMAMLFLPDGRAVGPSVAPLTGESVRESQ